MADALPIAGWYPDPEFAERERWWDGQNWSENRRPAGAYGVPQRVIVPAYAPAPVVRNNLALIGFILSMSGVVLPFVANSFAGGIVSAIGLQRSKQLAGNGVVSNGRGLSIAGILVGFIWGALCLFFIVAWLVFFIWIFALTANLPISDSTLS